MIKTRLKRLEAKHSGLKSPGLALILNRDKSFTIDGKHYSADTPWPAEIIGIFLKRQNQLKSGNGSKRGEAFFLDGSDWDEDFINERLKILEEGKR